MLKSLEQLHHSLAVITNLSLSIPPPVRASSYALQFLNAHFECSGLKLKCIGSDENSSVLKVMKDETIQCAMKVYLKDGGSDIQNMISRDQAYREFKALKLTSDHPNFLRLCSSELEECEVQEEESSFAPYNAWVIRFDYVANSMPINEFWFYLGIVYNDDKPCINYTTKSVLITHITHQMLSALNDLNSLGIRHRDLDEGNILIETTSNTLHVYLIDFARADLPDAPDLEYTESPNLKLDHGYFQDVADAVQLNRAYMIPKAINKYEYISAEKEPSDFRALGIILKQCVLLDNHRPLLNTRNEETVNAYEEELWKVSVFFDSLFLIENEHCVQNAIRQTVDPSYLQDEIRLCFDFFTGEANKNATETTILNEHRGACIAISNSTKQTHVDSLWESCRCDQDQISSMWEELKRKLPVDLVTDTQQNIHDSCENIMANLPEMSDISKLKRDTILRECFDVYKALTWTLYSSSSVATAS